MTNSVCDKELMVLSCVTVIRSEKKRRRISSITRINIEKEPKRIGTINVCNHLGMIVWAVSDRKNKGLRTKVFRRT